MKIYRSISLLGVCVATTVMLAGCSLLDVSPRGREKSEDLFSKEEGYKFALTGVYLTFANASLYGKEMSYQMPEWLVRHFNITTEQTYANYIYSNYDFENYRGDDRLDGVWRNFYHSVAQVNDMLDALEYTEATFTSPQMRNVIEGELYALRGFIHLELLRFFGPVPIAGVTNTTQAIPYMTEPTLDVEKLKISSWKTVVDGIANDLSRAEELLKEHDPILGGTGNTNADSWLNYRRNRMNYVAVLGTKARFYQWIANTDYVPTDAGTASANAVDNAVHYAQAVVGLKKSGTETPLLEMIRETGLQNNGFTLFGECLFAVDVQGLQENQKDFNMTEEGNPPENKLPLRYMAKDVLDNVFEASEPYAINDMRYTSKSLWVTFDPNERPENMVFRKYYDYPDPGNKNLKFGGDATNQVPILRLSEMYLILMEHLAFDQAKEAFNTFRIAKNLNPEIVETFTEDTRMERVQKEYEKEFYGEGQFFYFCKRKALPNIPIDNFALPKGIASYVMPMPRSQSDF